MGKSWLASPDRLVAKSCIECGSLKPRDAFGVSNGSVRSACQDCLNARNRLARANPAATERANERRRQKQAATKAAATQGGRRWTEREVAILLDDSLSELERAERLGRSYNAVSLARMKARKGELVTYEYPHGTTRYRLDGCRCQICVNAAHEWLNGQTSATRSKNQAETVDRAARRGQPWTGAEMDLLATRVSPDDLTLKEVALMLGRTYAACRMRRNLILNDPKWMKAAGATH